MEVLIGGNHAVSGYWTEEGSREERRRAATTSVITSHTFVVFIMVTSSLTTWEEGIFKKTWKYIVNIFNSSVSSHRFNIFVEQVCGLGKTLSTAFLAIANISLTLFSVNQALSNQPKLAYWLHLTAASCHVSKSFYETMPEEGPYSSQHESDAWTEKCSTKVNTPPAKL